jgi:hypothetical protein
MRFALYGEKKIKVKVLGTEEGKYHIEFENGSSILCSESELEWLD